MRHPLCDISLIFLFQGKGNTSSNFKTLFLSFSKMKMKHNLKTKKKEKKSSNLPWSCHTLQNNILFFGLYILFMGRQSYKSIAKFRESFPVNFAKFLRTPFSQNTSGRLVLSSSFFM